MEKKIKFLKASSVILKIVAVIFLISGVISAVTAMLGFSLFLDFWQGVLMLVLHIFIFFLLNLIAIIAQVAAEVCEKVINKP